VATHFSERKLTWIAIRKKTLKDATAPMNPAQEKESAANALAITWTCDSFLVAVFLRMQRRHTTDPLNILQNW
jgi:hypothetical protein